MSLLGVQMIQHTPEGEEVVIDARLDDNGRIVIQKGEDTLAWNHAAKGINLRGSDELQNAVELARTFGVPLSLSGEEAHFTLADGPKFLIAFLVTYRRSNGYFSVEALES
jgi:hypothetical protein